ncbi:uncharacterized protein LOC118436651 [Folsomia candida]|uniref:Uncharacterized protein n=1 Tax=Folsomia candida TaxID=158441 RepID=A0A226E1W5_FOLCA|nr:uncharacterized protein LOC118436651 [Folsomia candida]OXA50476.1 hypothetical protein Fcan01_14691 [Folsomia candida]
MTRFYENSLVSFCGMLLVISMSCTMGAAGQTNLVLATTVQPVNSVSPTPPLGNTTANTTSPLNATSTTSSPNKNLDDDALNDTLSYDSDLYSEDSRNKSGLFDRYYNGTNGIDNETYYKYNTTTGEKCNDCWMEKLGDIAGPSTIVIAVVFISALLILTACLTYRNIRKMVP